MFGIGEKNATNSNQIRVTAEANKTADGKIFHKVDIAPNSDEASKIMCKLEQSKEKILKTK